MRKNDKLLCINDIFNENEEKSFIKNKIYDILYVDNELVNIMVCLKNENDYELLDIQWILQNFIKL